MNTQVHSFFTALHAMPEPALREVRTSAYLAGQMEEMGFAVTSDPQSTAVLGRLTSGKPGPVVVLRSDMDALPYVDRQGVTTYQHTCGHDANAAMVLAAGQALAAAGMPEAGELRLLFQPAEEQMLGAKAVIRSGLLAGADIVAGIHLRPKEEAALHEATPSLCHGSCATLQLTLRGRSAHGARPHQGCNPIHAAALAIGAVNAIALSPVLPHSIKATRIASRGDAANCVPERVDLTFDLRCQTNAGMEELIEKARRAVEGAASSLGVVCEDSSLSRSDAAEPDEALVETAREAITEVLGQALPPIYTSGGEDFHFYHTIAGLRTVYIGLGSGMTTGLHVPGMTFDPSALDDGVAILTRLAEKLLRGPGAV